MKRLGKPDTGNPSVRFDEGSESDGHWPKPFNPSAPTYSTTGFGRSPKSKAYAIREEMWVMISVLCRFQFCLYLTGHLIAP